MYIGIIDIHRIDLTDNHFNTETMRALLLSFLLLIYFSPVSGQGDFSEKIKVVSYKGILSGDYHSFLEANEEYRERSEHYKDILQQYNRSLQFVDSLESFLRNNNLPIYFKERASHIAALIENNSTGDVYYQIRCYGVDFALVLNDLFPLVALYECERLIVTSRNELSELESWARSMAAMSEYFNHLFNDRKLNQPLSYYTRVKSYDKQIDKAFNQFKKDGYKLDDRFYRSYEDMFNFWQTYEEELQLGKNRNSFFETLEKKYGSPSMNKNTEK